MPSVPAILTSTVLLAAFCVSPLQAFDTDWAKSSVGSEARLVVASDAMTTQEGALAAVEIKLPQDWKTYWRSPGEAGLPPAVTVNGTPVEILYPLPKPIVFYGIKTYGYGDLVSLPFRVPAADLAKGGDITLDYMVCKDICVPVQESFTLGPDAQATAAPTTDISLTSWLKKVPTAKDSSYGLSVANARIVGRVGHQRVVVDGILPNGDEELLFIAEADGFQMHNVEKRSLSSGEGYRYIASLVAQDGQADLTNHDIRITLAKSPTEAIDTIVLKASQ